MQILIVEDDPKLAANLGEYLEEQGDIPDYAGDGRVGVQLCSTRAYDAVILDLRLPRLDGIHVCQQLRGKHSLDVPILMLTARDTVEDRIEGFEAGTDDYLVKPFSLREMYLRLCAIVRRQQHNGVETLEVGELSLDPTRHVASYQDVQVELTPINFIMLQALMRAAPGLVSRGDLEEKIWGDEPPSSEASLRGHIHRLRVQLETATGQPTIHTIHGVGYRLLPVS